MLSFRTMQTMQSALRAWNAKDWDGLAHTLIPLLPPLPSDGKPVTPTAERIVFADIIPTLQMPKPLEAAAFKYLHAASDEQVNVIADHVRKLAAMLDAPQPMVPLRAPLRDRVTLAR